MEKYIDAKWHYTKTGEYPIKFGKYMQQNYPQIPCLVLYNGMYGVRFWNCTEECWDDEECDDYFCEKEAVEKWLYIDALESFHQERQEVDLDEEMDRFFEEMPIQEHENIFEDTYHMIARHFYELGKNRQDRKIRTEIERLKKNSELAKMEWIDEGYNQCAFAEDCKIGSFDTLLSFLDTPSEEPDKDLEEAADEYSERVSDGHNYRDLTCGFIAGAKWQAEKDKDTIELAEEHAYFAGAVNEREQMLKEAKDGYVSAIIIHNDGDEEHYAVTYPTGERPHSITDKVKIIVIKEDDK